MFSIADIVSLFSSYKDKGLVQKAENAYKGHRVISVKFDPILKVIKGMVQASQKSTAYDVIVS